MWIIPYWILGDLPVCKQSLSQQDIESGSEQINKNDPTIQSRWIFFVSLFEHTRILQARSKALIVCRCDQLDRLVCLSL